MKKYFLILFWSIALCSFVQAQEKTQVVEDSIKHYELNEATVTATRLLLVTKNDTTIYDLDALNLKSSAMLRDAFEKLPGMTFRNGILYHNGREVKRVLINGMDFSGKDPMLALRALPSYIMKSVKVYEKKSDFAMRYDEEDGKEELVADVTVRRKYMGTWTGELTLGSGTDKRFLGRGFGNTFTDRYRVSLFGNANNINEQMWYNGDGKERAGEAKAGDNQFYTPGGTFFWKNKKSLKEKGYFKIEGGADYNRELYDEEERQTSELYLSDGSMYSALDTRSKNNTDRVGGHLKADWNITDNLSLKYLGTFDVKRSDAEVSTLKANWNENPLHNGGNIRDTLQYLLTADSRQPNAIDLQHKEIGSNAKRGEYNHTLGITYAAKNRTYYNISHNLNYAKHSSKEEEDTYYKYFNEEASRTTRIDRLLNKDGNELEQGIGARIMRYFDVKGFRSFRTYIEYNYNRKETTGDEEGFLANHGIEDETTRNRKKWSNHHSFEASMSAGKGIYNLELKPCFNYQTDELSYTKRGLPTINPTRDYCYFSLQSTFRIRAPKGGILARYWITPRIPDIENFITYPDMADPQHIIMGNENLRRGTKHGASAWYWYDFVKEKESGKITRNLSGNVQFSHIDNDVTTFATYNRSTGVVTVKPVNVSGNWNGIANIGFTTPLDVNQHFWLETFAEASILKTKTFSGTVTEELTEQQFNDNRLCTYSISVKPRLKIAPIDLSLAYELTLEENRGTYASANSTSQWQHLLTGKLDWQLPFSINLDAKVNYHNYAGYLSGKRENWVMLDLGIERAFLKKENLFVRISAHDLFNQNNGFQQEYGATALTHTYRKTLGRYGMLTLKYRFSSKKNR